MRWTPASLLIRAILCCVLCGAAIAAQAQLLKQKPTLAQAERLAVDLKQGMTLQEVENLLGKPRRTALRTLSHASTPELWQSALQWTYAWPGPSQSDWTLQVVFASSKSPERWLVQSWDWTGY